MFDADQRAVVFNRRYAELYDLSEDQLRPGVTLAEILQYHIANGKIARDNRGQYPAVGRPDHGWQAVGAVHQPARGWPLHLRHRAAHVGRRHGGDPPGHHRADALGGQDRAHGQARHPDRPAQPRPSQRAARAGLDPRQARRPDRLPAARSRLLQDRQRHPGAPGRRQAVVPGRRPLACAGARGRHDRPHGRRRIRHPADDAEPAWGRNHPGPARHRRAEPALRHRRPAGRDRHQRRHRHRPGQRPGLGRADAQRRPRAVSRQERWPQYLRLLRGRDGPADAGAPRPGERSAQGLDGGRVRAPLPADRQPAQQPDRGLRGPGPLAASRQGHGAAGHVHPARRGDRLHHPAR